MNLLKKLKEMFKKRQIYQSTLPDMEDGTYKLKERFPVLGDTPVQYVLGDSIVSFYTNVASFCDDYLSEIANLSELNEGYFDQMIDVQMHIGLKSLEQQRLNHQRTIKTIEGDIKMAINKKHDELTRYEESLQHVQSDIKKFEKVDEMDGE